MSINTINIESVHKKGGYPTNDIKVYKRLLDKEKNGTLDEKDKNPLLEAKLKHIKSLEKTLTKYYTKKANQQECLFVQHLIITYSGIFQTPETNMNQLAKWILCAIGLL